MKKKFDKYTAQELYALYSTKPLIDPEIIYRDVETLEKYLRFHGWWEDFEAVIKAEDFDLEDLRKMSKQYSPEEWKRLKEDAFHSSFVEDWSRFESSYKYPELFSKVLDIVEGTIIDIAIDTREVRTQIKKLYTISGKKGWKKARQEIDLFEIYEKILEAHIQLDYSIVDDYIDNYFNSYWERLKKDSPLSLDRYYAAMVAGKKEGNWIEERRSHKPNYPILRPAKGFLFYFDSKEERNAYVAQNSKYLRAIEVDDLRDLQWVCTTAVRPEETLKAAGQAYSGYKATIPGVGIMGIYETRQQAEVWTSLYPYQGVTVEALISEPLTLEYLASLIYSS